MPPKSVKKEKVIIDMPQAVMDYLRRAERNPAKYIEYSMMQIIKSDLDVYEGEWPPATEIRPILEAA